MDERLKEQLNPEDYLYMLGDLNEEKLAEMGSESLMEGGAKILRLARQDAEIRIAPASLLAKFDEQEAKSASAMAKEAFYELGDISGSSIIYRDDPNKPFVCSMTVPRLLLELDQGQPTASIRLLPTNPVNVIAVHERLFFMNDPLTRELVQYLQMHNSDPETQLAFTLEVPKMEQCHLAGINSQLALLATNFGYKSRAKEIDLSTALQSAVQRIYSSFNTGKRTVYCTTAKGPNGGNIVVGSFPEFPISLREVGSPLEAATCLTWGEKLPVTSIVIERPLV